MEEAVSIVNTAKERLLKIIDEIPEREVNEILDYAEYLKLKSEKRLSADLVKASESSIDFWDNEIDDEVWNDA